MVLEDLTSTNRTVLLERLEEMSFVDDYELFYTYSSAGKRMGNIRIFFNDTSDECQIYSLIKGVYPKRYSTFIRDKEALKISAKYIDNPEIITARNGASVGRFVVGTVKHTGRKYKKLVSHVLRGDIPSGFETYLKNVEVKEKLESLGFTVIEVDLNKADPTFKLDYKGYECSTSARTVRQGSIPSIYRNFEVYESARNTAIEEGYKNPKIPPSSDGVTLLRLEKDGNSCDYPLGSFNRGHRPFTNHGFNRNEPASIYLFVSSCGRYMKVGITKDVGRRVVEIARQVPFSIRLAWSKTLTGDEAIGVEREIVAKYECANITTMDKGYKSKEWLIYDGSVQEFFT